MATTREQNHATYCPECNEPVYRRSQFRGKIRFYHRNSQKLDCQWRGTDAIGYELEVMSGVPREQAETLKRQIIKERGSRATYVITAAQNATPVHENALKSLLTYCRVNKAQLLVVPYRYRNPCLVPETRVLTADLRWIPAGELDVGSQLVGFDEHSHGVGIGRTYKHCAVTATGRTMMPCYKITFDDGTIVVASEEHPWLSDEGMYVWRKTKNLMHAKGGARIVRAFDVWDEQKSKESGYIAAALDGEGSLVQQPDGRGGWQLHLTYVQKPNSMSAEVERCMGLYGVKFRRSGTKNGVVTWRVQGGRPEIARVLGQHRPGRLLEKLCLDRWGRLHALRLQKVVSCEYVGPREVVTLTTTSETFIAEGLATHNTSRWSKAAEHDDWWTGPVLPYLINHRLNLNKHLMLMGDVMIQPTAVRPLEGFESITGAQSGIFGHPKLELTTVPTPQADLPKILTTTGAITKKNYIPSKAGKKGEFHHTFGATVVEINGDRFYMRQLNMAKDGSFCDLLTEYDGDKTRDHARIPGLVMGDTHVTVIDPGAVAATFDGPKSIVETLKPEQLVWHDLYDGSAKNHHERGRVFHDYVRYKCNRDDVEAEVRSTFAFIDNYNPVNYTRHIIVPSNHGDFLREWVENTDPRRDPKNCMFWAESFQAILKSDATTWTDAGVTVQDLVAYWGKKLLKVAGRTTFLRRDQTHRIKGIEVSYHGDKGPGGKPGSREGLRKIGVKSIIGHGHGPGIEEGCYQVGTTSRLNLTYAAGTPSGWLHCHAAILPNGKRQLLIIVEGKWRP